MLDEATALPDDPDDLRAVTARLLTRSTSSRPQALQGRLPHGPKCDLLQVALQWLGTRGLLGLFLATFTTVLRALLGFDETRRQLALSFAAALFVIGLVARPSPSSSHSVRKAE